MTDVQPAAADPESRMPAIYLGHGAPPLLDDQLWTNQLKHWARSLPQPKAILIISAHWEAAPISLSSPAANTPLVYDFWGFEERFYRMTYETPDASDLSAKVNSILPSSHSLYQHPKRGLDHGAWVPLKVMYPDASIPVLQLSLPTLDPEELMTLGQHLIPLRDEGILIIGSGFLTHGLRFLRDFRPEAPAPTWSIEFDEWAKDALSRGAIDTLMDFHSAPGMPYAHPTTEHFAPLFVTLGASMDPEHDIKTTIDGFFMGLAKRSIEVN